jgi:GT2 family glycosyltransferase
MTAPDHLMAPRASGSITIAIGTCNRLGNLSRCLDALRGRIAAPCRIVVADAGSSDGTIAYLEGLADVELIREGEPIGQARSLNRVLRNTATDYFCWLSDDNVARDGMIDLAVAILDDHEHFGMVALKTKDVTGPHKHLPYIGGRWETGVLTCNQGVVRTDLLQRLGGFDEALRDYGIDADLTARVLLTGRAVAFTKAVAIDHERDHDRTVWIDREGRRKRLAEARDLYRRKYDPLVALVRRAALFHHRERLKRIMMRCIDGAFRSARLAGLSLERTTGWNTRDISALLFSRYVSIRREISCRKHPYHLVQEMPARFRAAALNAVYYHDPAS